MLSPPMSRNSEKIECLKNVSLIFMDTSQNDIAEGDSPPWKMRLAIKSVPGVQRPQNSQHQAEQNIAAC